MVDDRKAKFDDKMKKIQEIAQFENDILTMKARIKELQPIVEKNSTLFHSKAEVEGLYQSLSRFAGAYGLVISKMQKKKPVPILKAGNMSLGVNLLMYLTEIASKSLNDEYLSKIFEVHHKHKKDYPSGTALMLGKGIADGKNKNLYNLIGKKFLNKKSFPYGKKINFNSIRKGEIVGEHEVKFSSGKEIITLNHEAFDRALYSDGALTDSKWLMKKKPGLYSMRNLLNFS